jgi:hypothetical protein
VSAATWHYTSDLANDLAFVRAILCSKWTTWGVVILLVAVTLFQQFWLLRVCKNLPVPKLQKSQCLLFQDANQQAKTLSSKPNPTLQPLRLCRGTEVASNITDNMIYIWCMSCSTSATAFQLSHSEVSKKWPAVDWNSLSWKWGTCLQRNLICEFLLSVICPLNPDIIELSLSFS